MQNPQQDAALREMNRWLSHPGELGKEPSRIVCAGTFERYGMTYYIFKFKKTFFGKWLVGVCGGYEAGSLHIGGQPFSNMTPYRAETAEQECVAMVDMICGYWKQRML